MSIVNFNGKGGTNYRNGTWKPYEVGYKKDYQTELNILVYDGAKKEDSNKVAGNEVLSLKAWSAFPLGLPSIPLAWESTELVRLTVPFSYTDFEITRKEPENQAAPAIKPKIQATGAGPASAPAQNPTAPARVSLGFGGFGGGISGGGGASGSF